MNRKKTILLSTVAGIVLLLSLTAGFLLLKFYRDTAHHRYIRESWEIQIPLAAKEVYHEDDRGWFGDGDWYTVFTWNGEGEEPEGLYPTQDTELDSNLRATMDRLDVPSQYRFDLLEGCLCRQVAGSPDDELILVFDPAISLLYVIIYTW